MPATNIFFQAQELGIFGINKKNCEKMIVVFFLRQFYEKPLINEYINIYNIMILYEKLLINVYETYKLF